MLFLSCSYFGSVNFTEGWCSGTKAAHFSQPGSYATVPNVNITDCNLTIACWIRQSTTPPGSNVKAEQSIITVSSVSGKSYVLTFIKSLRFGYIGGAVQLSPYVFAKFILTENPIPMYKWTHIAVSCENNNELRLFVDGKEAAWNNWPRNEIDLPRNITDIPRGKPYSVGNTLSDRGGPSPGPRLTN